VNFEQGILPLTNQRYTIAFPDGYPGDGPYPLILALHFAGHGAPYYGRFLLEELVAPALRDLGAIIVAPDCTAETWSESRSESDVLSLVDYVLENYGGDVERVLVTGYSLGGNGAWYLSARNPDIFSAAIVISGWPPVEIGDAERQVPVYVIHSRDDEFIPLEPTQSAVTQLSEFGAEAELLILEGITHFETYRFIEPLKGTLPWIERVWQEEHHESSNNHRDSAAV
jgi:predicted peptidase